MHFSVLVVGKDKDDVIKQLEYYSEDREVESYLNVPFDDVVDDVLDRYESEYKGLIEKTKSDPNYVPPAYKKGDLDRFLKVDFTAPEEEVREKLYELFAKDWGSDVREDGVYSSYNQRVSGIGISLEEDLQVACYYQILQYQSKATLIQPIIM